MIKWETMVEELEPYMFTGRTLDEAVEDKLRELGKHGWRLAQLQQDRDRDNDLIVKLWVVRPMEEVTTLVPYSQLKAALAGQLRQVELEVISIVKDLPSITPDHGALDTVDRDTAVCRIAVKLENMREGLL